MIKLINKIPVRSLCLVSLLTGFVSIINAQEINDDSPVKNLKFAGKIQITENQPIKSKVHPLDTTEEIPDKIEIPPTEKTLAEKLSDFDKKYNQPENNPKKPEVFGKIKKPIRNYSTQQNDESIQADEDNTAKWEIPRGTVEYGAEFGYAPNIATWLTGPKVWDTDGHKHLLASVRWGRILGTKGIVTFSYAIEFAPVSLAIGNEVVNKNFTPGSLTQSPTNRETTYGFHINPASFRFIFFPKLRLRPFIGSGVGPSYHVKNVPIPSGTKWNLMIDFQIGGQYMLSKKRAVQFGYRYFHLSNVYLSGFNPGYNTNMLFFGYSVFK